MFSDLQLGFLKGISSVTWKIHILQKFIWPPCARQEVLRVHLLAIVCHRDSKRDSPHTQASLHDRLGYSLWSKASFSLRLALGFLSQHVPLHSRSLVGTVASDSPAAARPLRGPEGAE